MRLEQTPKPVAPEVAMARDEFDRRLQTAESSEDPKDESRAKRRYLQESKRTRWNSIRRPLDAVAQHEMETPDRRSTSNSAHTATRPPRSPPARTAQSLPQNAPPTRTPPPTMPPPGILYTSRRPLLPLARPPPMQAASVASPDNAKLPAR